MMTAAQVFGAGRCQESCRFFINIFLADITFHLIGVE